MRQPRKINNWKVVLLSLIAASIFWVFRALGKQHNTVITQPVVFSYNQDSFIAVKDLPSSVNMEVTGGGWDLLRQNFRIGVQPIEIVLQKPTKTKKITKGKLLPLITNHLGKFRINYLYIDSLPIKIEEKKEKKVRLILDSLSISLAENHQVVSNIRVLEDSILLLGPASFIDTLQNVYRLTLDYQQINNSFNRKVKINLPKGHKILARPDRVPVSFEVEEFYRKKINLKIDTIHFPYGTTFSLTPLTTTLTYTIQSSYDKNFEEEEFKVTAKYQMMNLTDSTIPLVISSYPDKLKELALTPDTIKLIKK